MSELRKDYITNRWIVIATERAKRPHDFKMPRESISTDTSQCPFCPGNEKMTPPEVYAIREKGTKPDTPGWTIRVVPNKFPALKSDKEPIMRANHIFYSVDGFGYHEVIIETPDHFKEIPERSLDEIAMLVRVWKDRIAELGSDPRIKFVMLFKNYRPEAGASLSHPHSQIIALPIIPKRILEELEFSKNFYWDTGGLCLFDMVIEEEKKRKERIVYENDNFVVLSPYAARVPFEVWILPKRHEPYVENIRANETESLADALKVTLEAIRSKVNDPPYNLMLHTAPSDGKPYEYYHWHIEIMPKLTRIAGFEWGTGFYINPTPPELAARILRGEE